MKTLKKESIKLYRIGLFTLVGILFILIVYFFLVDSAAFLFIIPLEIVLFSWLISKGKWELHLNKEENKKWRNSIIFNIYLIFLILHLIFMSYFFIESNNYTPDEFEFSRLAFFGVIDLFGFMTGSMFFILFLLVKKAPKQILAIPLLALTLYVLPALINFSFEAFSFHSYFFVILQIILSFWAIYVRFVFLRSS